MKVSQPRRGITTIADLRARADVDPATHCWIWNRGLRAGVSPAIHTFDHAAGEKRTLSGPRAVFNIAHGRAPIFPVTFMRCMRPLCVNPAHVGEARDRAELGRHVALSGVLKGTHVEMRRALAAQARAAAGHVEVSPLTRAQILQQPLSATCRAVGALFGVSRSTVSRVRRAAAEAAIP